jgi:predicted PurR-regulated permease PerM
MDKIDIKKLNQVLRICSKILKKAYIFIFIISIYIGILILNKLNIMLFIVTVLKILSPLFIGIVIAWLLNPIIKCLERKLNRTFSVIIVYIIILFLIYLLFSVLIPIFIKETNDFLNMAPELLNNVTDYIDGTFSNVKLDLSIIKDEMFNIINEFAMNTGKDIPITLVNTLKGLWSFVLGLIIGFYLLITNSTFIRDILDKYLKKDTYELLEKIDSILRNYVRGTFLSSLLILVLSAIIFYIGGLKSALLFGFICGITNIIPFIGPYIGAFIPVLVAFTKSMGTGILVTVMILIIQTIEGNIIHPLILSKSIKIHPVTVIISLLVFGYFFGIIGMIISTPLVAILKLLCFYSIKKYRAYKRKLVR